VISTRVHLRFQSFDCAAGGDATPGSPGLDSLLLARFDAAGSGGSPEQAATTARHLGRPVRLIASRLPDADKGDNVCSSTIALTR
jgi:hypothetical protein